MTCGRVVEADGLVPVLSVMWRSTLGDGPAWKSNVGSSPTPPTTGAPERGSA